MFVGAERTVLAGYTLADPHFLATRDVAHAAVRSKVKRGLDILISSILLFLLLPFLMLVGLAIRLGSPGPALFGQSRVGYLGRVFRIYKFRSMQSGAALREAALAGSEPRRVVFFKLRVDPRVTPLGRILRKFSIDELPQLYNVLLGDMSLVGPRPLLLSDVDRLAPGAHPERFTVRPGLTGLWQVNGRSECTDAQRLRYDREYVEQWSLSLDVRILLRTLPAVLGARGAY